MTPVVKSAIRNHVRHRIGRLLYRRNAPQPQSREVAFKNYWHWLFHHIRDTREYAFIDRRKLVDKGDGLGVFEIKLRVSVDAGWRTGDLIYIHWRNLPGHVEQVRALLGEAPRKLRLWDYGTAFGPEKYRAVTPDELLESVLDLTEASASLVARAQALDASFQPDGAVNLIALLERFPTLANWRLLAREQLRIKPRFYTVSRQEINAGQTTVELLVSTVRQEYACGAAPAVGRSGAFLTSLEPGAVVRANRMPHPHRLPVEHGYGESGICIVTGTGIAAVLVCLRAGVAPKRLWLIWGVRNREDGMFYREELEAYAHSGLIERLDVVESRPRVGQGLRTPGFVHHVREDIAKWLEQGAGLFISGHREMGESVRRVLREASVEGGLAASDENARAEMADWSEHLRYIETTSG